ncbi:MAG: hypothetical protein K9M45_12935 [Kiritimatiellales bacterium]|nr:hypothetical protein [Kiritimatiellales bacterium]
MKKHILERYRRDSSGTLIIDIAASKVSDLYDDFDKHAPFVRKELDYDLVEYLIESTRELCREPFAIHFSFSQRMEEALMERVRKSVRNYFDYLLAKNRRELRAMFRNALILLLLGVVMLSVSIYINHAMEPSADIVESIMAEGLVIVAWVSMWEAIAGLLMNWQPLVRERMIYHRLKNAELVLNLDPAPESP